MDSEILTLLETIQNKYIQRHQRLTVAESCTGGGLSYALTSMPGCSAWFVGGWTVYSNQAKQNWLAVDEKLLQQFGAVSEPVALALANNALRLANADIALSITGIAGPNAVSLELPAGFVWFGLAQRQEQQIVTSAQAQRFAGDREDVRKAAIVFALRWLAKV